MFACPPELFVDVLVIVLRRRRFQVSLLTARQTSVELTRHETAVRELFLGPAGEDRQQLNRANV